MEHQRITLSTDKNLKKLLKIIHQKQKEVDRYKKMSKGITLESQSNSQAENDIFQKQREMITQEMQENKEFLKHASVKMNEMGMQIQQLQEDLREQQARNCMYEKQVRGLRAENKNLEKEIVNLATEKKLIEHSKEQAVANNLAKTCSIDKLEIQNEVLKNKLEQCNKENKIFQEKLSKLEDTVYKAHITLQGILKKKRSFKQQKINSKRDIKSLALFKSDQSLKSTIYSPQPHEINQSFQQLVHEIIQKFKNWEVQLSRKEEEWKENFQKQLSQRSIDGISKFVRSFDRKIQQGQIFETSSYRQNEENLLKNLQEQCIKSEINEIQKQKEVELSEIKQTLRHTKDVNAQLFEELGKKESIIKKCKQTFEFLQKENLFQKENTDNLKDIRAILGMKN